MAATSPEDLVSEARIRLGAHAASKEDAIREACQLLSAGGCVAPGFTASVLEREKVANTFLGHGVAIPHGLGQDRNLVLRDGIAILQVPQGVEWNPGQHARLVVAIAAKSDSHITLLRRLTRLIQDDSRMAALFVTTQDCDLVLALGDEAAPAPGTPAADLAHVLDWVLPYPAGLHARPASQWVEAARRSGVRLQVRHGDDTADARNLVGLLSLGLRQGDTLRLSADGEEAQEALQRFRQVLDTLTAQERADAERAAMPAAPIAGAWVPPGAPGVVHGLPASPGLAVGRLHVLAPAAWARPRPASSRRSANCSRTATSSP